ncbi:heme lyase NrfEFG subunit NrfE, partial [Mesorhizobium sp. M2D.F.Ca.ET.223.01.1.1]|uniref:cytochrome c-type biogenesis CcmF C-terminal domain-containing protein n=1 Tax=Mesorhizobium sp. M2D.F.Ca.ET.223.01.1.1 TaxID=2563940 RepID=UPI0011385233
IVGTLCFGTEKILSMHPGETVELSGHTLRFEGLTPQKGPNFTEDRGRFLLMSDGNANGEITSAKRFYPVRQTVTTESGIRTLGLSQLYLSLGDENKDGSVVVRLWWKPLVTLIWGGGLVMMAGAAMSLLDRRLRV